MADWWGKLKRAWVVITARFLKSHKTSGNGKQKKINGGGNGGGASPEDESSENGYSKLRSDIENCEYEDIHILWNLLTQMQGEEAAAMEAPPPPPRPTTPFV